MKNGRILRTRAPLRHRSQERGGSRDHRDRPALPRGRCINSAAVDPATKSILVNSEDGILHRWGLGGTRFSQKIQLTGGVGEAYTPALIGADGAVYATNNATLFPIAK